VLLAPLEWICQILLKKANKTMTSLCHQRIKKNLWQVKYRYPKGQGSDESLIPLLKIRIDMVRCAVIAQIMRLLQLRTPKYSRSIV